MNPREFLRLLRKQPFQPLKVLLSNGKSYEIPHPDVAVVTKYTLEILSGVQDVEKDIPETVAWISWLHIAHVEPLDARNRAKRRKSA